MSSSTKRWGDLDLDDEPPSSISSPSNKSSSTSNNLSIPPTHTSRIDSKGIKLVTSYRAADPSDPNSSSLVKTITKIRVQTVTLREHTSVGTRRKWKKFGQAAVDEDQSNVTIHSRDDIYLEDPNADTDLQEEDVSKALAGNLNSFWEKQKVRALERKYGVGAEDPDKAAGGPGGPGPGVGGPGEGWNTVGADKGAGGGKYVPPSQRGKMGAGSGSLAAMATKIDSNGGPARDNRSEQNTIRVTNISEDTTESDLQELFQPFGRISRVYLAKDKETMQSRGFAFVSFVQREDAAKAMDKLQGYGYDHLILKLEWARPSAPKTDPGSEGTQFRSGYGKALAQDTTQKVSFASNLTR